MALSNDKVTELLDWAFYFRKEIRRDDTTFGETLGIVIDLFEDVGIQLNNEMDMRDTYAARVELVKFAYHDLLDYEKFFQACQKINDE